ncbi:MAG: hypothetical protein IMHGJWDQ_001578 [Candidatus Fervidibacter sp.]
MGLLKPNLDAKGRWARGLFGIALLALAFAWAESLLRALLSLAGAFCLWEAVAAW